MKTRLHSLALGFLCLCATSAFAQNDAKNPRNYADNLIGSSGVINPQNAVDNNRDNYAVLRTGIGILNFASINVGFSNPGEGGQRVDMEVQNDHGLLTADVLQSISVSVFDSKGNKIAEKNGFDLTEAHVIEGSSHYKLSIHIKSSALDISSVKIRVSGLLTLANRLRLYNVWLISNCPVIIGDVLHASHHVLNPNNAISQDRDDYALLTPPLLLGNSYLDIEFSQPNTAGKNVRFNLGEGNALIDASLLNNITLTVYNTDGDVVANQSGFTLADAEILPNGKFYLRIKTPHGNYQIGRGRITFTGLVNVLTTLKVYNVVTFQDCPDDIQDVSTDKPVSSIDLQTAPNPFNSYTTLNIKSKLANPAFVVISDKAGNVVEQHQVSGASSIRLLQNAPSGIYFIKITSGKLVEVRKVIKM
jgi:hypothetical protein